MLAMTFDISSDRDRRSLTEVIDRHKVDFGKDARGLPRSPPLIPMCRLVQMEVVRTLQRSSESIEQLRESFLTNGYSADIGAKFYVQPSDECGKPLLVTDKIRGTWDQLWHDQSAAFEVECDSEPEFAILKDKMFSVFDGNHHLFAWSRVAEEHQTNPKYHPQVSCIVFKGDAESMVELELAMHSVNKLMQAVVKDSWILEADRVKRILDHPLEHYKSVIPEVDYEKFKLLRGRTKNPAWYSKQMPLDIIAYIMAADNKVKFAREDFENRAHDAETSGKPWTDEEKKAEYNSSIVSACRGYRVNAQKMAPLWDPVYGPTFMAKCAELYAITEKMRREKAAANVFDLRIRSCSAAFWEKLLKVHCLPDIRKEWYHPPSSDDDPVKQWMFTWTSWFMLESIAEALLDAILDEIMGGWQA